MKQRHLVVFDIDGTLIDSVRADFQCFARALDEVFAIDTSDIVWERFPNMTDSALIRDVVFEQKHQLPTPEEIKQFQVIFFELIRQYISAMTPVAGMQAMWHRLATSDRCQFAFATGGWKKSAAIKLSHIGVDINDFPHATADDFLVRTRIISLAVERSRSNMLDGDFSTVTYVGDGLWDFRSAKHLGINFVGMDVHQSGKLRKAGATKILTHFENVRTLEDLLF